jgi:hypothetical protein
MYTLKNTKTGGALTDDHGKVILCHTKEDAISVASFRVQSETILSEETLLSEHQIKINSKV